MTDKLESSNVCFIIGGHETPLTVSLDKPLYFLIPAILEQTGNTSRDPHEWEIRTIRGVLLWHDHPLAAQGVKEGDKLFLSPQVGAGGAEVWEFDRYVDGQLKAEGVRISRARSFEEACKSAVSLAPPRSVLVLRRGHETGPAQPAHRTDSRLAGDIEYCLAKINPATAVHAVLTQVMTDLRAPAAETAPTQPGFTCKRCGWSGKVVAYDQGVEVCPKCCGSLAQWALDRGDELADWINRARPIITELMEAYARRIRSDCIDQADLECRPWRCSEYIAAEDLLRDQPKAVVVIEQKSAAEPFIPMGPNGEPMSPEPRTGMEKTSTEVPK